MSAGGIIESAVIFGSLIALYICALRIVRQPPSGWPTALHGDLPNIPAEARISHDGSVNS
jgi:hypothetical protein